MQIVPQNLLTIALHIILRHLPSGLPGPQQSSKRKLGDSEKTLLAQEHGTAGVQNQAGRRRTPKMGSQVKLGMSESQDKEMSELESRVRHKAETLKQVS